MVRPGVRSRCTPWLTGTPGGGLGGKTGKIGASEVRIGSDRRLQPSFQIHRRGRLLSTALAATQRSGRFLIFLITALLRQNSLLHLVERTFHQT